MKTDIADPWCETDVPQESNDKCKTGFEDSFVESQSDYSKLDDSEEYLAKLYSRLRNLQKGTSKKDLVSSLSVAKEDCIARLITSGHKIETEEEIELSSNPLIRHIVPHLQALTASELVHLLKADVLQVISETEEQKIDKLLNETNSN
ncbi:uncharacterized protein LOC108623468 isoform X2 [Ceratina calcarata]|uniref:Uncharacterized protein LOC108623468 isoform X1 n=1 Tax=Ceratina calcarata TaxID=156304 RepID=A0AAJ7IVH7_9HYME|nr:uncharacterized protein LOC108623468 isoform X1 [Ceratina calcarata]XP_017877503.1 uncharacterized protein LOC108623468 isoform X2 [Ceratina calcarata]